MNIFKKAYLWFFHWRTPLWKQAKWFYQRGKRGYSDRDLWGFDEYLTEVISKGCRELSEVHIGCPSGVFDESRKGDECWKWRKILHAIADGFEAQREYADWATREKWGDLMIKSRRGFKLFEKYFSGLWW